MKTSTSRSFLKMVLLMGLFVVTTLQGCQDGTGVAPAVTVDPYDPNALSKVIVFPANTVASGTLPQASNPTTTILNNPSVSMTSGGSQVYIPIQYSGSTPISNVYIQVSGANTYFKIPVSGGVSNGMVYIPMSLPDNVLQGDFTLLIVLVGSNGSIVASKTLTVPVDITLPLDCGDGYVSGSSGITQTEHKLNGQAGTVNMIYDTYSLPDRIDVYVDGIWVAGTGSSIAPPPPLSTCSNPLAGFVGKSGTFSFKVTAGSKRVQTYVSGCTGSSTAWNYELTCP